MRQRLLCRVQAQNIPQQDAHHTDLRRLLPTGFEVAATRILINQAPKE